MSDPIPGRCRATSKGSGQQCKQRVPLGHLVCRWHGGNAPQVRAAAERRAALAHAQQEHDTLGLALDLDPLEALRVAVCMAAGDVQFWRAKVAALAQQWSAVHDIGDATASPHAIAGPDHLGDGAPHVYVVQYEKAQERLARVSKLAADAGVDVRRVQLAERQGELIAQVIRGVLGEFGLADHPDAAQIVRKHLELMSASAVSSN